jgi:hypothetical protein
MRLTTFRTFFSSIFCRPAMPRKDAFLDLFTSDSSTTIDTHTFLNNYINNILVSKHCPDDIYRRFMVKSMTVNKTDTTSQHEFLTIEIYDATQPNSETHLVYLERTATEVEPGPDDPVDSDFANHADSFLIIDVIKSFLSSRPAPATSEEIPLVSLPLSPSSSHSLGENISLASTSVASTRAVHRLTESFLAKTRRAGDHFVVGRRPSPYYTGTVIRQILPSNLPFFDIIILANVVHDHKPLYSLLSKQCFWFVSIIHLVIEAAYDCDPALRVDHSRSYENELDIRLPPNVYLPDIGGRWKGLLITRVSKTVVQLMKAKFEKRLEEEWSQVSLQSIHFRWKSLLNF